MAPHVLVGVSGCCDNKHNEWHQMSNLFIYSINLFSLKRKLFRSRQLDYSKLTLNVIFIYLPSYSLWIIVQMSFISARHHMAIIFIKKNINRSNVLCVYILNIFWSANESIAINIEATVYLIMVFLFVYVHMYCVMFIIT